MRSAPLKSLAAAVLCASTCVAPAAAQQKPDKAARAAQQVAEGRALLHQGDQAGAVEALRGAVKLHENYPDAWFYLGLALREGGDFEGARKALKKSLALAPSSFPARVALAYTSLLAGRRSDAEAEGRAALGADARAEPEYVFGILHLLNAQPAKAAEEAETILRGNRASPHAHLLKAQALIRLISGASRLLERQAKIERYAEAARALEEFLSLAPPDDRTRLFWREQLAALRAHAGALSNPEAPGAPLARDQVTEKAVILRKPLPMYSESAREAGVSGGVKLSMVLAHDGTVKHILVLEGLTHGLTEQAIHAAREIAFKPALKDGRPVSQIATIDYNFNVYGGPVRTWTRFGIAK